MAYALGAKSRAKLVGVHPIIVKVVERAISISEQDFGVYEGLRTVARQKLLVAAGASHTLDSMHIPRPDQTGKTKDVLGHAVDLVPWIDGEFRWEWGPCYEIAAPMDAAATELNVAQILCWGGVCDKWMAAYGGSAQNIHVEVAAYQNRHRGIDFIDGPHFQISRLG